MSVRKRTWKGPDGEPKEAWVVDYVDQGGDRHIKTFARKKEADAFHATVGVAVREGTHTADRKSVSVARAAELWLKSGENAGLERATLDTYRQHVACHIDPIIGTLRLSRLSTPMVRAFEDQLLEQGRSAALVRKVRCSLGALLADAQERGLVAQNVARTLRKHRNGKNRRTERGGKLKVGIDIPTPAEISAIIGKLSGHWRPMLLTAIFTGLRASELRGLRWEDIDLKAGELHVRQRADRYLKIGDRSLPQASAQYRSRLWWLRRCASGSSPAPRAVSGLLSPTPKATLLAASLSSSVD